jgi:hypothetical protein
MLSGVELAVDKVVEDAIADASSEPSNRAEAPPGRDRMCQT